MADEQKKINKINRINVYIDNFFKRNFCEYYLIKKMDAKAGIWFIGIVKDEIFFNFSEKDVLSHKADDQIRRIIRNRLDNHPDEKIRKQFRDFRMMNEYVKEKIKNDERLVDIGSDVFNYIVNIISKKLLIFGSSNNFNDPKLDERISKELDRTFLKYMRYKEKKEQEQKAKKELEEKEKMEQEEREKKEQEEKAKRIESCKQYIINRINNIFDYNMELIVRRVDKQEVINRVLSEIINDELDFNILSFAPNSAFNIALDEVINKHASILLHLSRKKSIEEVKPDNSAEVEEKATKVNLENMRKQSVTTAKTEEEYEDELCPLIEIIKKIPSHIKILLLVAVLLVGYVSYKNNLDSKMIQIVQEYGESDLDIDDRIIRVYRAQNGEEDLDVRFAGFYAEYIKLTNDNLNVIGALNRMELKFLECKKQLCNQRDDSELANAIHIKQMDPRGLNSYSFLDFVYDRLSKSGKYPVVDTVIYKDALQFHNGRLYVTTSKEEQKYNKIIEDVMKMYCKFARSKTIEAGKNLDYNPSKFVGNRKGMGM